MRELLENPTQAVNDMSYFNCLDSVMENSKVRGRAGSSQEGLAAGRGRLFHPVVSRTWGCLGGIQPPFPCGTPGSCSHSQPWTTSYWPFCLWQVLGEAMAGISQNAKNSKLPEFGDSISTASKALCGFTEAAAQVRRPTYSLFPSPLPQKHLVWWETGAELSLPAAPQPFPAAFLPALLFAFSPGSLPGWRL